MSTRLALGATGALACLAALGSRRGSSSRVDETPRLPDIDVSLECLCADDFGAGYKSMRGETLTAEDEDHLEQYEETRERQLVAKALIEERGLGLVDVLQTDDRTSKHSDCYVRFSLPAILEVSALLNQAGLNGDVLDGVEDEPEVAAWVERTLLWHTS